MSTSTVNVTDKSGQHDSVTLTATKTGNVLLISSGRTFTTTTPPPTDIWTNLDGRLNAPAASAGTQQYPTLLNNYTPTGSRAQTGLTTVATLAAGNFKPPWQVAGIDYPVGIKASAFPLKDPGVAGATLIAAVPGTSNGGSNLIQIDGANVLIDGWDMSLHNSLGFKVSSGGGGTIQNCNFLKGSNSVPPLLCQNNAGPLTFQYNKVDGNGVNFPSEYSTTGDDAAVTMESSAALVQYNYFTRIFDDCIRVPTKYSGTGSTNMSGIVRYNLIDSINNGLVHSDFNQLGAFDAAAQLNPTYIIFQFNTYYMSPTWTVATTGGNNSFIRTGDNNGGGSFGSGVHVSYNTMIMPSTSSGLVASGLQMYGPGSHPLVHENYFDNAHNTVDTNFVNNNSANGAFFSTTPLNYGNIKMTTGGVLLNQCTFPTVAAPATPNITSAVRSSGTVGTPGQFILNGTSGATGLPIFVVDPTTIPTAVWPASLYGTTTTTAGGNWTFTSGTLSAGLKNIQVYVTNANGDATASNTVTVTI